MNRNEECPSQCFRLAMDEARTDNGISEYAKVIYNFAEII